MLSILFLKKSVVQYHLTLAYYALAKFHTYFRRLQNFWPPSLLACPLNFSDLKKCFNFYCANPTLLARNNSVCYSGSKKVSLFFSSWLDQFLSRSKPLLVVCSLYNQRKKAQIIDSKTNYVPKQVHNVKLASRWAQRMASVYTTYFTKQREETNFEGVFLFLGTDVLRIIK